MFPHNVRRPLWPIIIGILVVFAIGENSGSLVTAAETARAATSTDSSPDRTHRNQSR
jgi:hypothetical protein